MHSNFQLPPIGFGPGSQDPDGEVSYLALPSGMRTYSAHIPETDGAEDIAGALNLLRQVAAACDDAAKDGHNREFDLSPLPPACRALLAETLGQGEVSMKIRGLPAVAAQESVFAGVWVLAGAGVERLEVGAVPMLARQRAHTPHRPAIGVLARRKAGVVNAPAILSELIAKSTERPGMNGPHVVNLSLLPHTEPDLDWLDEALGEGAVTILSRGYGNCRITALAQSGVWRVQFFNSMDVLILDTFEVTTIPEVALAAPEDLQDSAARIIEVIGAIG